MMALRSPALRLAVRITHQHERPTAVHYLSSIRDQSSLQRREISHALTCKTRNGTIISTLKSNIFLQRRWQSNSSSKTRLEHEHKATNGSTNTITSSSAEASPADSPTSSSTPAQTSTIPPTQAPGPESASTTASVSTSASTSTSSSTSTATSTSTSTPSTSTNPPPPTSRLVTNLTLPLRTFSRLQDQRPYLTQILTSLVVWFLGDLSAQYIAKPLPPLPSDTSPLSSAPPSTPDDNPSNSAFADRYDPPRSLRAVFIGGLFSIPSYLWFIYLSTHFAFFTHPLLNLSTRVVINQALFAPVINTYFFGMHSLLSGRSGPETWHRLQQTLPIAWYNSCRFWPLATAFAFTFVPIRSRSMFMGVVAVGWQAYLGMVNQRAAEMEVSMAWEERRRILAGGAAVNV